MGTANTSEITLTEWLKIQQPSKHLLPARYNDGGRREAGYTKPAKGDCVTRAIAIATGLPYQQVYDSINEFAKRERKSKRKRTRSSASDGVYRDTTRRYMESLGWEWVSTMQIGSGCRVHLRADEMPRRGTYIVKVSKHLTVVKDGVIYDTHNPSRGGTRCVYGYYRLPSGK